MKYKPRGIGFGRLRFMYCSAPFPAKPRWRIKRDKIEKHVWIDLGRVRMFWQGKGVRPKPFPYVPCEKLVTHEPHMFWHYNIDKNRQEYVCCRGDYLTYEL